MIKMKTSQRIYLPFKRLIGILGSFVGIIVCFVFLWWWVIPVNAIVTRGHPFFARHRIGKDGKNKTVFEIVEFITTENKFETLIRETFFAETLRLLTIFICRMAFNDVDENAYIINSRAKIRYIKLIPCSSKYIARRGTRL